MTQPLPLIIALEGNIGSGKSTILKGLETHGFKVLQEPLDEWDSYRDSNGSMLEHLYRDPKKHAFTFQIMCLHTRAKTLQEAVLECQQNNIPVLIMERSLLTTYQVFTKVMIEEGNISPLEARIFRDIHLPLQGSMANVPIHAVFIDTHVNYCMGRIQARARGGEDQITMDYLTKLDKRHRQWLNMVNHYHVNGDDIKENVLVDVMSYIRNLLTLRAC